MVGAAHHSCALHGSGAVSCWGLAAAFAGAGGGVLAPTEVAITDRPIYLVAASEQTCAITLQKQVRCWGAGGRDGERTVVVREDGAPLSEVSHVALGAGFGCAVRLDGIYCWGKNDFGQLARSLTLPESPRALLSHPGRFLPGAAFVGAGIAVVSFDGKDQICAWGRNATHLIDGSEDLGVHTTPRCRTVEEVSALSVGDTHACVRRWSGESACWGERYYGQLGNMGTGGEDVPPPGMAVQLPGGVDNLVTGVSHTCVLGDPSGTGDGRNVWCFGRNHLGQVGSSTPAEEVGAPVRVANLPSRARQLGAGSSAQHTCAIVADGSVWCWGSDSDGQLGSGKVSASDPARFSRVPVAVAW